MKEGGVGVGGFAHRIGMTSRDSSRHSMVLSFVQLCSLPNRYSRERFSHLTRISESNLSVEYVSCFFFPFFFGRIITSSIFPTTSSTYQTSSSVYW